MSSALHKLRKGSRVLDSDRNSQLSSLSDSNEVPTNNPRKAMFDDTRGRSKKALGQQLYRQRMTEVVEESDGVQYSQEYPSLF